MDNIFYLLMVYYTMKYFLFIILIAKGYEKNILEVILFALTIILFGDKMFKTPLQMLVVIETELILSNLLLILNVIVLKSISFKLLVSITHDDYFSKILCKMLNKKRLCKKLKDVLEIDFGPRLKFGLPGMAGRINKKTKVKFDRNGFPKFKTFYTIKLRRPDYKKSREMHFYYANKKMYKKALKNKKVAKIFTKNELIELSKGETPARYTWHHHQDKGKMQLVSRKIHAEVNHIGGYSIWGGEKK